MWSIVTGFGLAYSSRLIKFLGVGAKLPMLPDDTILLLFWVDPLPMTILFYLSSISAPVNITLQSLDIVLSIVDLSIFLPLTSF